MDSFNKSNDFVSRNRQFCFPKLSIFHLETASFVLLFCVFRHQITERNAAKQPNENRPNNQTKYGQTTKRKPAKQPNENRPNNQIGARKFL